MLVAAFASMLALLWLAFLLHALEQPHGARGALCLLALDASDLACSDLDGGPGTAAAHTFSVFAAWVMPGLALALAAGLLLARRGFRPAPAPRRASAR